MTDGGSASGRAAAGAVVLIALVTAVPVRGTGTAVGDPLADCRERVQSAPDDYRSYNCFWAVGRNEGVLDRAARDLRSLLDEDPTNPHRRAYLAAVEMDRGRAESAAGLFRRAADDHARLGSTTAEAHVRLTLAFLLTVHLGRLDEAEIEIARVRALMSSVTDPSLAGWLAMRETSLANARLEFGKALRILRGMEPEFFPEAPWALRQLWLNYMGFTWRALGRLDAASRAYRAEAELLRASGAPFEEAVPLRNLTLLAIRRGESEAACLKLAAEALDAAVRGRNRRLEASVRRDLSFLTTGDERLQHAEAALEIARETEYPLGIIEGLRALALALVETDPSAALALVRESIALAEEQENLSQTALGHQVHAELLRATAPRRVALNAGLRALDIIETTRRLQPDPEIRARHFGIWTDPYYDLAAYLLDRPGTRAVGQAFDLMERMRARTLLDELEATRVSNPAGESRELVEERQKVLREIASEQRGLFETALPEDERARARARLLRLESDEARLREDLRRADPAFAAIGQTELAALEQVQDTLADDQAMMLFQVPRPSLGRARRRSWLLAVTRAQASIYELPTASWIESAVTLFNGLVAAGESEAAEGAARLYGELLAEAVAGLGPGVRSLVIVPDRSLHLLPFGALRAAPHEDPLGVRFAVSIAPSATVWRKLRAATRSEVSADALVLADPGRTLAPASDQRAAERLPPPPLRDLGPLPFARTEARSVIRRTGGGSRLLAGVAASEAALKEAHLSSFGVIHLAAHAILDTEEPHRSGILLVPGSDAEDGLVQAREVAELDLGGQLVVLSACRTAGGVVLAGEGPMSLARPFLLAGASTVVASLWPLPDREAAELFDRFYHHLSQGLSAAAAMSRTRGDLARRGSLVRAWAGVVVLGDGDRVPFPAGVEARRWPLPLAALLLPIILGGVLWLTRRTRARPATSRVGSAPRPE